MAAVFVAVAFCMQIAMHLNSVHTHLVTSIRVAVDSYNDDKTQVAKEGDAGLDTLSDAGSDADTEAGSDAVMLAAEVATTPTDLRAAGGAVTPAVIATLTMLSSSRQGRQCAQQKMRQAWTWRRARSGCSEWRRAGACEGMCTGRCALAGADR